VLGLFFYLFENTALLKAKARPEPRFQMMLLRQGNDTQRQTRYCGSTAGDSTAVSQLSWVVPFIQVLV
jgi:hypothetical protein